MTDIAPSKTKVTVTRKGKTAAGRDYTFSISVTGMSINDVEVPAAMIKDKLDEIANNTVKELEGQP